MVDQQNPNEHETNDAGDGEQSVNDQVRGVDGVAPEAEQSASGVPGAEGAESFETESFETEAEPALSDEDFTKLLTDEGVEDAPTDVADADGASGIEAGVTEETVASPDAALAQERLQDLQRVTAEYANYRRRTERERAEDKTRITGDVLKAFLPVLDDLDRAEQHGDLGADSPFAVIASKLRATVQRVGLEAYGEAGEAFDPTRHEAIAQIPNPEVQEPTIADVVERGYRIGEHEVRVAKVAVFVPAE